ncbi:MAG TPA: protein-methionine-sulfoxide reductase heme-binding subunit MsrQ [Chloroflexota bacterium]|nr:protein-methionine-sulfoxide reductase heme-binding subunit MsrQ [Chloroflexota bacterium]
MTPMTEKSPSIRRLDRKTNAQILRVSAHIVSLYALALLLLDYYRNNLGADPVREILLRTGEPALVLLILSLAITPLTTLFGWKQLHPLRRIFGLYAFLYVVLHFLTFVWLDYGLNLTYILDGILEQNFVLVGFAAFVLLLPLAITSNKWSQRKLGKKWRTLHKLVYIIILLALIHFWWLVKNVYYMPFLYSAIVTVLLLLRWQPVKQKALRFQRRYRGR